VAGRHTPIDLQAVDRQRKVAVDPEAACGTVTVLARAADNHLAGLRRELELHTEE
jgi:hypothetical protein